VTDKVKEYTGNLRLWVSKTRREKFGHVFSFEGFCGRKRVGNSDTEIDQYIKNHMVNLECGFSKYFPEAISDK
jgi:hypothetical protein